MKTSLRRTSPENQSRSKTSLGTLPHEGACFGVDSLCALLVSTLLAREEESVSRVFSFFRVGVMVIVMTSGKRMESRRRHA